MTTHAPPCVIHCSSTYKPEEQELQLLDALVVGARDGLLAQLVAGVVVDGERHVEGEQVHQLPEQLPCAPLRCRQ